MLNSEVKKRINDLHDILVGQLPLPSERLELITVSLIYKFMEDMDNKAKKIGGKPSFFVKSLAKSSWSSVLNYKPNAKENAATKLVENFSTAIRSIAKAEHIPDFFRSIFNNVSIRITNGKILKSFMDEISKFEYIHSEELGNAFEHLLKTVGNQKENGAFRTPRNIIHFIVNVVDPQKSDTILDPACGTGGFLIEAATHIKRHNTSTQYKNDPNKWGDLLKSWKGKLSENIQGYDNTPLMVRLSKVNMFLHQLTDPQIHEYDTISSYTRWNDKFDVILANPPFMTPKGGIKAHDKFKIQAKKAEVLFSDYILEHLKPGGKAGIIVPEGIIANSSNNDFVDLRKWALKEMGLWAVVSLPAKIFEPYSGVKTSILLIDRNLAKNRKDIILLKIENDGFSLNKNREEIKQNDLPEAEQILKLYKEGKSLEGKQWKVKFNIVPKEDFDKLDTYRASTTAWKVCKRAWERLDKAIVDLNVKLSENNDKRSNYEEQYLKAVENFKDVSGITFKAPNLRKGEFENPISKDDLKELFSEQVKGEAIKFGNLEKAKLSDVIVDDLIDARDYDLSYERFTEGKLLGSEYEILSVADLCEKILSGGTPSTSNPKFWDGSIPWITSADIQDLHTISPRKYITEKAVKESAVNVLPKNNILVVTRVGLGKLAKNYFDVAYSQDTQGLIVKHDIIDVDYFLYMLTIEVEKFKHQSRGVTIQGVTKEQLATLEIPVPSFDKQKEIVAELLQYQNVIKGCENLIENYVPSLPPYENWEVVRMEDVCSMVRGPFGGALKKEIFVESGYKVYEQSHAIKNDFKIGRYYITKPKFEEMKRFALQPGDLIMSCSGTMGKVAVFPEGAEEGIINQALLRLIPDQNVIRPMFLKLLMDSPHFQAQLFKGATGVAIKNVAGVDEIKGFEIALPSLDEQDEILTDHHRELQTLKGVAELKTKMEAKIKELVNSLWGVPAEEGEMVEA